MWNVITKMQSDLQEKTTVESNRDWKSPITIESEQTKKSYKSMFGVWRR